MEKNKNITGGLTGGVLPKFDWYQGTFKSIRSKFIDALKNDLLIAYPESVWMPIKPMFGYEEGHQIELNGESIIKVYHQFRDRREAHLVASGSNAQKASEVISEFRRNYCDLSYTEGLTQKVDSFGISRVDSALDLEEEGLYEKLVKKLIKFAKNRPKPIKVSQFGDWTTWGKKRTPEQGGRTLYLGSGKSVLQVRIYEKGYERSAKLGTEVERPDWVRIEVQYRPQKIGKVDAVGMHPVDIFSLGWVHEAMKFLALADGMKTVSTAKVPDSLRARYFLVTQYRKTLMQWMEEAGGWDQLSDELKEALNTEGRSISKDKTIEPYSPIQRH